MIHIESFTQMLEELQRERGLSKELLVQAIQAALISACKKRFLTTDNLEATIDETGEARILAKKKVVKKVENKEIEITLTEAKKVNAKAKLEDEVTVEVTPSDFGRLAAQTAKQVIIQRIREAEKETAYDEFSKRVGQVVTGMIQRKEYAGYLVNLGRIETLLPLSEVIPGEIFRPKDRIKFYVVEVKKTPKGPLIVISRTHPGLVKKLFELEVPEIVQGILEIKTIAR